MSKSLYQILFNRVNMKKYSVRKEVPESAEESLKSYPEILRRLLFYRGIENSDDAEKFLNPDYIRDTHDPFLMKDMSKSVERILKAIERNEKIMGRLKSIFRQNLELL